MTIPEDEPTVATEVLLLLQVPPPVASESVDVSARKTLVVPVMAAGNELTVTTATAKQPSPKAYVIAADPADTAVTTPEAEPTVATPVDAELHDPPEVPSLSEAVDPAHRESVPVMGAGTALTVTMVVVKHPPGVVQVIVAVPGDTPDTIPDDEPTVAMPVAPEVQIPPDVASLSVDVNPAQTAAAPVMAAVAALMVTVAEV